MREWYKQVLKLNKEGYSGRQIAKQLGRSKSQVNDIIKKYRIDFPFKLLFIDIESSMLLCYTWGLWNQNISISQIRDDWYLFCYCANWMNNDDIISDSIHHYDKLEKYKKNEKFLVENLWYLLDEADAICAYNGIRFDKKKINTKFLEYGYPEPSPYSVIDPLVIVKQNFSITSNKMDYVTKFLGNDGKHKTDIQLWIDCMNDDEEALSYMEDYCKQDIVELKNVYNDVKHWCKNHPNIALYFDDDELRCNTCGSTNLNKLDKTSNTQISQFESYRCNDCGKVMRNRISITKKSKRDKLLVNKK